MRVLFVSNYYPPHARGGYEQWCQEVAAELGARGHQVHVITSRAPQAQAEAPDEGVTVERTLHLEVAGGLARTLKQLLWARRRLEQENIEQLRASIARFAPDAALLWGMWNLPRSVPAQIEALLPSRVAYFLCDYWLSLPSAYVQQLQNDSARRLTSLPKQLVGRPLLASLRRETRPPLRLAGPLCVSHALKQKLVAEGVPIAHAQVVYGGIRADEFAPAAQARRAREASGLKLLYAGRLSPEKGVHTAIRALAMLSGKHGVTLDLIGRGESHHERELRALIAAQRLEAQVQLRGAVSRAEMPNIFAQYDALIFPSEWAEPFARTVLEAMASGLVVIGTTTGGTGEVLVDGATGLTFAAGDARALAAQIERLRADPVLGARLAEAGRRRVAERYGFIRMVDELEAALYTLAGEELQIAKGARL